MPWGLLPDMAPTIGTFRADWPKVEVRIYEQASALQVEGLRDGTLDLGIMSTNGLDMRNLETRLIENAVTVAAVPAGWDVGMSGPSPSGHTR